MNVEGKSITIDVNSVVQRGMDQAMIQYFEETYKELIDQVPVNDEVYKILEGYRKTFYEEIENGIPVRKAFSNFGKNLDKLSEELE